MMLCECGCGEPTTLAKQTVRARGLVKGQPNRFLPGHHAFKPGPRHREEDRGFETPCWIWLGALNSSGYGSVYDRDTKRVESAYRAIYREHVGAIPEGNDLHHRCDVRACVNPAHLEPLTRGDHLRITAALSRPFCPRGHPFDEANTVIRKDGSRACRTCVRRWSREYMRRKRAALKAAA